MAGKKKPFETLEDALGNAEKRVFLGTCVGAGCVMAGGLRKYGLDHVIMDHE